MHTALRTLSPLPLLALFGCSPHPGTGEWQAEGDNPVGLTRLEVRYEGWADLYARGEDEAGRRCFWGGTGKQSISLTCSRADDPDAEEHYTLNVDAGGTATLSRHGQAIGRFVHPKP